MTPRTTVFCIGALVLGTISSLSARQSTAVAIGGVTVIDGTGGEPLSNATVIVENERVACVGRPPACRAPSGARPIDGRKHWLIPGLFDAHVHISERAPPAVRPLYLAFGVTSVRDMGGEADLLRALRREIAEGRELGPRLFLAGHPLDGDPPKWPSLYPNVARLARTPDEARQLVADAAAGGSDFIKLYHGLTAPAFDAAVSEAHARGLKATADLLPWTLPQIEGAIAAGVDGIEHGLVVQELNGIDGVPPRDLSRVEALLSDMAKRGVVVTSTLVLFERAWTTMIPTSASTYRALPPAVQAQSKEMVRWSNAREATWFNAACRAIGLFAARGGIVLAGTDSFFLNVYPGDVHRELELLVECGLTPAQALAAATRNPAAWLRSTDLGLIAAGKIADLVLLRANPLADIANTQRIELVIQGGKVWTPKELLAAAARSSTAKQ